MARERDPLSEPQDLFSYVDLRRARLCLDCEVIFEGPQCPACTSQSFVPVTRWIRPTEQRETPRLPTEAPPHASKKQGGGVLKKSLYVGLGAYGVWKMLFQPARPRRRRSTQSEGSPAPPPEDQKT